MRDEFGVSVAQIVFLPLGNDVNTAVYRVEDDDGTPYFLKLRSGTFNEAIVAIPQFLSESGVRQIIGALRTCAGKLSTRVERFAVILYPFVAGHNGFTKPLSESEWMQLGTALNALHMASIPSSLRNTVPMETYSPLVRERVREFQAHVENAVFPESTAAQLADFIRDRRTEISFLVERAEVLGRMMQLRPLDQVLCHADIHAANVLLDETGRLYLVDWDTMTFAPKERDLMFIGGGVGGNWNSADEGRPFYRGYGETKIDLVALAYFRFERIVQDIAEFCDRLLLTNEGGADRERSLQNFFNAFGADDVVEMAYATDRRLRAFLGDT